MIITISDMAEIVIALASVGGLVTSIINNRKIQVVHLATNSMKDELVVTTKALGIEQGRDQMRKEHHENTIASAGLTAASSTNIRSERGSSGDMPGDVGSTAG